ncbi:MAG TPA: DMT family transporter [Aggregatilineales bacterium]|nr:DMT family transporter [Aggregatilineales bacterium]
MKPSPKLLGIILGIGVLAMSSATIFIRLAQGEGVPSIAIAAYRMAIATAAITLPAVSQQAWRTYGKLTGRDLGVLVLAGMLLGMHFAVWITSLAHTSVVSSVVLVTTTPLWAGLASPLILKERTPRLLWGGMALAIVGGAIIGLADWSGGQRSTIFGNALALSGAFLMAGYLIIGRSVRERLPLVPYLWIVYSAAAALLTVWALVGGLPLAGYPPVAFVWLVALGLIPQLIGHTAANYAVRHVSATFVGVTILGEPIGSTILAMIVLNEWPTPLQIFGGALILSGIVLASLAEERKRARVDLQAEPADQY